MPLIGTFGAGASKGFGQGRGGRAPAFAEYLIVSGGGGGGAIIPGPSGPFAQGTHEGGGGAGGGYRTNYGGTAIELIGGQTYTITVGTGGAATSSPGSPSSIVGEGVNLASTGGGRGGGSAQNGQPGGSGGGGGCSQGNFSTYPGGSGNAGSYSPSEGQNGGSGQRSPPHYDENSRAGGGGGAGGTGGNGGGYAYYGDRGGNGGAGLSNSITGSSVGYAGGGAGDGSKAAGSPGGSGGGAVASPGTDGLGGGGGGNAPGGDGVVILRIPTASYSGDTTGSPTVTTDGTDTIITWTSSGSYTA